MQTDKTDNSAETRRARRAEAELKLIKEALIALLPVAEEFIKMMMGGTPAHRAAVKSARDALKI